MDSAQRPPKKPDQHAWAANAKKALWGALATGGILLVVGLLGLVADQPWLFPSLGPTAFLQVQTPYRPASSFYNTVVGHSVGLAAGFFAVLVLGAGDASSVMATHHLTAVRMWAAVLAMTLTMLVSLLLKAPHPPAAATTLLVALGGFAPTVNAALTVEAGVLIVAVIGEGLRRVRYMGATPEDR